MTMIRIASRLPVVFLAALLLGAHPPASEATKGPAQVQGPTPAGVWLHANKRIQIEIAPCADRLCATVVWLKKPNNAQGLPLVDVNNPDPALRARPVLGLQVLKGLRRTGPDTWVDGDIYNPDDGTAYRALMSIGDDGTLQIRAYVLVSVLGKTLIWTRVS